MEDDRALNIYNLTLIAFIRHVLLYFCVANGSPTNFLATVALCPMTRTSASSSLNMEPAITMVAAGNIIR